MRKTVAHRAPRFDADAAIRGAGLVRTAVRSATLAKLAAASAPMSHPELSAALPDHDRASVFRALRDFVDAGLARRVELGDHVWRFSLASGDEPAGAACAFQCDACGRSVELANMPRLPAHADIASVARVYLRGVCARCAKK